MRIALLIALIVAALLGLCMWFSNWLRHGIDDIDRYDDWNDHV